MTSEENGVSSGMTLFPPTPETTPINSPRLDSSSGNWHGYDEVDSPLYADCFWFPVPMAFTPVVPAAMSVNTESVWTPQVQSLGSRRAGPKTQEVRVKAARAPSEVECQKALRQLDGDVEEQRQAIDWVMHLVWPLAASMQGCRVVQRALDKAGLQERVALAEQLKGHVIEACISPHANHVLQRCAELLQPEHLQFALEEIGGQARLAARHRYGCRVLERLIERCPLWQTASIVSEVVADAANLCRHAFGNFVVQHVLQHGTAPQRRAIVNVLLPDIQRLARHRVASHVVRSALAHSSGEDRQRLVATMAADAVALADLAHHHCGSFVAREMRKGAVVTGHLERKSDC